MSRVRRIAVTGAAGSIAYSLLFRLASGALFGEEEVELGLLETPAALAALEGVAMELRDCAFPLLRGLTLTNEPEKAFEGAEAVFLVGAKPRTAEMERGDLLAENGKIFTRQGEALERTASEGVKILVIGNPCNTNCLLALSQASRLSKRSFFAMTRLDQNRATALLASRAGVASKEVSGVIVWGNHSATQVPDPYAAVIQGHPAKDLLPRDWLEGEFMSSVQQRGTAIIRARGSSSAASAASAALDAMRDLTRPTEEGEFYSMGLLSDGNPYGIAEGLVFSFPCRTRLSGEVEIVPGIARSPFIQGKIAATERELIEERESVEKLFQMPLGG